MSMKIIGRSKDYYDYLQGIWGQDPKAVYDRKEPVVFNSENRPVFMSKTLPENIFAYQGEVMCRCGVVRHHCYFENRGCGIDISEYYAERVDLKDGEAPLELAWLVKGWEKGSRTSPRHYSMMPSKKRFVEEGIWFHSRDYVEIHRHRVKVKPKCYGYGWGNTQSVSNPILATFPFTCVPAETVFIEIQDYLLSTYDDKTLKDKRTDVQKLEAAGFDRKTSFRK